MSTYINVLARNPISGDLVVIEVAMVDLDAPVRLTLDRLAREAAVERLHYPPSSALPVDGASLWGQLGLRQPVDAVLAVRGQVRAGSLPPCAPPACLPRAGPVLRNADGMRSPPARHRPTACHGIASTTSLTASSSPSAASRL